jgi:hypothetical protein
MVESRTRVCIEVTKEAHRQGVDPVLAAAVSWRESSFIRTAKSKAGAVGPMQVIPKFWCNGKSCDLIEAGVRALKYYTTKYNTGDGLCAYFSGKRCSKQSVKYRDSVLKISENFQDEWMGHCVEDGC